MQVCLTKSSDSSFNSEEESIIVEPTKKVEERPKIKIVEDEEVKKEVFEEGSMIRKLNFSTHSQESVTTS